MKNRLLAAAASILLSAQPLLAQGLVRAAAPAGTRTIAPAVATHGAAAPTLSGAIAAPALPTTPNPLPAAVPSLQAPAVHAPARVAPAAPAALPFSAAPALSAAPLASPLATAVNAIDDAQPGPGASPVERGAARARFSFKRWAAAFLLGAALLNPAMSIAQTAQTPSLSRPAAVLVAQAQPAARAEQGTVLQARDIADALARYDASVRVIVIGDVGLGKAELQRLASSLAGKHWTVVLVQDASGMRYTDAEGRTHFNDDAVDYGTGQGLYKKEGVLSQTHPETGERDGAILTLVMGQRILLLRTADAYNLRGLDGNTQFKGNLDQWAVASLKASGDIVGAVEGTVSNVTALLEGKIAAEKTGAAQSVASAKSLAASLEREGAAFRKAHPEAFAAMSWPDAGALRAAAAKAEQQISNGQSRAAAQTLAGPVSKAVAALDRARTFDQDHARASETLASARAAVDSAERAAGEFRSRRPDAAGDLARPAVADWRALLKDAGDLTKTDPARAAAAAGPVAAAARAHADALAAFPGGADRIAAAQALHKSLSDHPYADAAPSELVAARQELAAAREAYEDGASAYAQRLENAKSSLGSAEDLITQADASAAAKRMWAWILIALANVLTLGGAFWLNRRSARFGAKAEELYQNWNTALDVKLEAVVDGLDEKMDTYVGAESGPKARGWVGKSAELSAAIRLNAGTAKILLSAAQLVHDQVRALVRPKPLSWGWVVNLFWPSRYQAAVRRLQDEPVEFKPQDGVEAVLGKKRSWQEDLYGDLKAYEPFKKSFNEVIAAFNERSASAAADLARLESAVTGHGPALGAVAASLAAAEASWQSLQTAGSGDGLFLLPSLGTAALPAGKAALGRARETVRTDPVGGLDGDGALGKRIGEDAAALAAWVTALRSAVFPGVDAARHSLKAASISGEWLADETTKLSGSAETAAAKLTAQPGTERLSALSAAGETLASRAVQARRILKDLGELRTAGIAKTADAVDAARAQVGTALGLEADKMLREKGRDPTAFLADAAKRADETAGFLGQGDLSSAATALKAGNVRTSEAAGLVRDTLASLAAQEATLAARLAESAGLEALAPERIALLDELKRRYADSVLALGAGDASHPNGNGTVADNPAEARAEMDQAAAKTEKAVAAFRAGRLLEAAALLDQADAHQNGARHRLDEIADKKARLEAAVAENARTLAALDARKAQFGTDVVGDGRTMRPTLAAYEASVSELETARKAVKAPKGDPFKAAAALASVTAAFERVWVSTRNDRDAHAEAGRSLEAARRAIDAAGQVARQAANDQVADSPAITAALRQLEALGRELLGASDSYQAPHGDWNAVDHAADHVTAAAGQAAGTLRGEIQAAEQAVSAISSAGSKVREATNWSGSYGVYISGSPGSGELDSARSALSRGDYGSAQRHAEAAYHRAASAIAEAEAEESRKRRAEEERQRREREEQERRERAERERRDRANDSGGSSGGSGGGGSSWGGSGSGNGRSGW